MKIRMIFSALLFLSVSLISKAQTVPAALTLKSVSVIPNSVNGFYLLVNFRFDLDSQVIDDEYFLLGETGQPKFHITYQGVKTEGSCINSHTYVSPSGFGIKISGFTGTQIKYFLAKDNQIGVQCDKDFIVRYYKASLKNPSASDYKYGIVKATDINNLINKNLTITDSDRASYVTAVNTFYYFENKIDVGVDPGNNGSATSFVLSASLRNKYAPSKLLSCKSDSDTHSYMPRIFWSLSTRLSTDFSDSLNFISYSPINLSWASKDFARELNVKLSNESDQTFTNKRAAVDASYRCIIPNLVNLTTPQDNRLRLKPVINFGIKGYYDYSNGINAFSSGQGYAKGYYYIPVYNNYSIIINGTAFYDLSTQRNPDRKISTNYSIVVASELPLTGFKAILKYENGVSDIDYKTGQSIVLGLLMDFLKEKNTPGK